MTGFILQLGKLSSKQVHWLGQGHTGSWSFLQHHCGQAQRFEWVGRGRTNTTQEARCIDGQGQGLQGH